ncbi:MAG: hypothetical protein QG620_25 [Patescibacteria group bacterium]|nr:hypothetical protein [Patescibacteria group bacterium]
MGEANIYNKYKAPEKGHKVFPERKSEAVKERKERKMLNIPLEYGESDSTGEKEVTKEVTYIDGQCFINGKESRFSDGGREIIKHGKEHLLNDEQREIFEIGKLLKEKK